MASKYSSGSTTVTKKPPKIKQACDCCHARKIRCNGASPCNNCQATSLPCTYLLIPKKKGPKGPSLRTPRAVLKMRMHQEQSASSDGNAADSLPPTSPPMTSPTLDPPNPSGLPYRGFEVSPSLSMEVVQKHLDHFFTHKYPVFPILDRNQLRFSLKYLYTSPALYALVTSLCAAISSQAQPDQQSVSSAQSNASDHVLSPEFFIKEAKRAKAANTSYDEKPTLRDAQTNFFLFAALFNLDRHNSAWFHLREAITMLQMLRLHEEATYLAMEDELEALYSRRTFWLLFVTERAYALQRHRPLTLQRTISLPTISPEDPDAPVLSGFLDLVSLFQHFDDNFVRLWNISGQTATINSPDEDSPVSSSHLQALQKVLALSIPEVSKRSEVQQADLLVSRQWLKTMVWQLCVTKGLLSSSSRDESMSFHYPVTIARDVVVISRTLNKEAFEPHGVGILEKIFDIGCSLADVLQLHPGAPQASVASMEVGPRDCLMEMLRILSTILGGQTRYLPILAAKVDQCLHSGVRVALEPDDSRIVELDDENNAFPGAIESMEVGPSLDAQNYDNYNDMFDFGTLSQTSMAWLGSMSDDSFGDISGIQLQPQPLYQHG